ncbi:MFS transporter [Curvibacter sp. APW13]|uniref:MFS transporter n=1 Tax=Curvibacter sp. APW13 TaxID=3077236 RepID=UPI0028E0141D|nr:MFS transporter [Curvibacter sp. APW13]MDT8991502.1 MFS transporter [Curvibacter sp. APW13]
MNTLPTQQSAPPQPTDWRSITALNATSTLAQVGQFGVPFIVLPVWLSQQGATPGQLALYAAALWAGHLPGLAMAPQLCLRWGPRRVILAALLCSLMALTLIALGAPAVQVGAGFLAGLGMGLRWIALEPWLYHIAPDHARGRLVGFHETLIGLAPIVAPALCGWWGVSGMVPFGLAAGFIVLAIVPLLVARPDPLAYRAPEITGEVRARRRHEAVFIAGVGVALIGGMSESAFAGLFPLYTEGRAMDVSQTTTLLTLFGVGGVALQYPLSWLADHRGLRVAAYACAGGVITSAALLSCSLPWWALQVAVFLLGGFITAYLTLALIASALTRAGSLASNASALSITYTASAVVGPLGAGAAIQRSGGDALMWSLCGVALLLVGWLLWLPAAKPRTDH